MVEIPFSDAEKRFILTEALKASQISLDVLISLVQTHEFNLGDMLLPGGRTANECLAVLNELVPGGVQTRHGLGSPAFITQRRQLSAPEGSTISARRIQPRPVSYAGEPTIIHQPIIGAVPGRKRGRPSKADLEARAARGEIITPRTPKRKSFSSGGAAPIAALLSAEPSSAPPYTATRTFELDSDDPAKKKPKRGRPTKAEMLAKQVLNVNHELSPALSPAPTQAASVVPEQRREYAMAPDRNSNELRPITTIPGLTQPPATSIERRTPDRAPFIGHEKHERRSSLN